MAQQHVGVGFRINPSVDAWWAEDWVATREDPSLAEEIEASLSFHVPVLGVIVDAVGSTAAYRAQQAADSILGALWLAEWDDGWRSWPPTLLGAATIAEDPRSPDHEGSIGDGLLSVQMLQVDSRGRTHPTQIEWRPSNVDVDQAVQSEHGSLLRRVSEAHRDTASGTVARRVAAACRFLVQSARFNDPGSALLHATIALESLVGDQEPGRGATGRFIERLSRLLPGVDNARLRDIYAMRSEIAHQGFTKEPFEIAAGRANDALALGREGVLAANGLANAQGLDREHDYLLWLG